MPNITLHVDDEVVRRVRKVAIDRHTTLTEMVREFLESVAKRDEAARARAAEELDASVRRLQRNMGPRTWTRDDLYER